MKKIFAATGIFVVFSLSGMNKEKDAVRDRELHQAVRENNVSKARKIIQEKVIKERRYPIDAVGIDHSTALQIAAAGGSLEMVKLLVDNGADANTGIWQACGVGNPGGFGDKEVAAYLVGKVRNKERALADLCLCRDVRKSDRDRDVIKALVEQGVPMSAVRAAEFFPWALDYSYIVMARILFPRVERDSAMHSAIRFGYLEFVKPLVENGARVDCHGDFAPFHQACGRDSLEKGRDILEIVQFLLRYVSDIDETDKHGLTALAYACRERRIPVIKLLLKNGAQPHKILPTVFGTLDPNIRYILDTEGPGARDGNFGHNPQQAYIPAQAPAVASHTRDSQPAPRKNKSSHHNRAAENMNAAANVLNAFAKVEKEFADDVNAFNG